MAIGNRLHIEVPTIPRKALPNNLLAVAEDATPAGDDRWLGGITWETDNAGRNTKAWSYHQNFGDKNLSMTNEITNGEWDPLVFFMPYECSSVAADPADYDRVKRMLEEGCAGIAEYFFQQTLLSGVTPAVTGTPAEVVAGLAETFFSEGLCHMRPNHAEMYLYGLGYNASSDAPPRTAGRGDRIVTGAGYVNENVIFQTGPVRYFKSDVTVIDSPENITTDNRRILVAEMTVAFQADADNVVSGLVVTE